MTSSVRLAHLSDIHLTATPLGWRFGDWFTKRVTGWMNLRVFGRGESFADADTVLAALMADLRERRPDHIVFSGDATALGFESEVARAASGLLVGDATLPPGLAVPGNHDYYLPPVAASGIFEKHFAAWQHGQRIGTDVYPFAQRVGPLWLIGVNSCKGNVWPGDATGSVGPAQLDRLRQLLGQLDDGPRILVTHYPVAGPGGHPERPSHGLRDLAQVLEVADKGRVSLWLHGHEHHAYRIDDQSIAPFPVICVGSSTQRGRWTWYEYHIDGLHLRAVQRTFDPQQKSFREAGSFEVKMRG